MKKLLFILLILAGCAKEPSEEERQVQLSVDGKGYYSVTYGIKECVTVNSEYKWSSIFTAFPGDTIQSSVKTNDSPATICLTVEVRPGFIFCKSLYVEPQSVGTINYILNE